MAKSFLMENKIFIPFHSLLLLCFFHLIFSDFSHAKSIFSDTDETEIKYFLSAGFNEQIYKDDNFLTNKSNDSTINADFRLLLDSSINDNTYFKLNLLETYHSKTSINSNSANYRGRFGRSSIFTWYQHDSANSSYQLIVDTINMQWQSDIVDINLGRQPINLATTFYFSPNDFFIPFAAQTFFRTYKPGVDAFRAEISIDELSQFTLLAVLAYDYKFDKKNSTNSPNWSETSLLARYSQDISSLEWAILGGTVNNYTIVGGSCQTELFDWLGVRTEGHMGFPEIDSLDNYYQWAGGIEHYHENGLFWRLEYFYNQRGHKDSQYAYQLSLANQISSGHLGKQYAALGVSYEITPLLNGSASAVTNLNDDSKLYSLNFVYSTSDESELSLTITLPTGPKADQMQLKSEYGSLPSILALEYRLYF